jgi:PhzF family phenazine biosynthesis protein
MALRQFTIDAFADRPFTGNPAAIVEPLDAWPSATWMQTLAQENNLAETAFLLRTPDPARFGLRWFTPAIEVPLCGHATLAAAHMLFAELGLDAAQVVFDTQSGPLTVRRTDSGYEMDFPSDPPWRTDIPAGLADAMGTAPREVWAAGYLLSIFASEVEIHALDPDQAGLKAISGESLRQRGNHICVALADPGSPYDVVSRFFAPGSGIPEDPVTGSAHCTIAPLFAARLGKDRLVCRQAFPGRGGTVTCTMAGDRVLLAGQAVTVVESVLRVSPG